MSDELLNGGQRPTEVGAQHEGASAGAAGAAERGRSPSAAEPAAPADAGPVASSGCVGRAAQVGPAEEEIEEVEASATAPLLPLLGRRRQQQKKALSKPEPTTPLTAEQRLLILDTWLRSGLPAGDFGALVGVSKHTLYAWKQKFESEGPGGLMDKPKGGPRGSRLSDLTKRTILMLKQANPSWGCQRISDMLVRGPALPASPAAVATVLHEAGYRMEEVATQPHPQRETRFERASPNSLWQTDLFTLKGIEGLVPADRFFGAAMEVKKTLAERVQANALELARHGVPKAPFYMTGQAGGQPFSVHAEGERMILTNADGRKEIDLLPPSAPLESAAAAMPEPLCPQGIATAYAAEGFEEPPGPGESPLDAELAKLREEFGPRQAPPVGHVSDLSGQTQRSESSNSRPGQVGDVSHSGLRPHTPEGGEA